MREKRHTPEGIVSKLRRRMNWSRKESPVADVICSTWPVCRLSDLSRPKLMGAALIYARRHGLFTLMGLAGKDDLDAGVDVDAGERLHERHWFAREHGRAASRCSNPRSAPRTHSSAATPCSCAIDLKPLSRVHNCSPADRWHAERRWAST
jgi:hypothetical protein